MFGLPSRVKTCCSLMPSFTWRALSQLKFVPAQPAKHAATAIAEISFFIFHPFYVVKWVMKLCHIVQTRHRVSDKLMFQSPPKFFMLFQTVGKHGR